MKLGIVGNCQVRALQECLVRLAPDHGCEAIQVEQLQCTDEFALNRIVELAGSVDVLFAHSADTAVARQAPQQALRRALAMAKPRKVVTIPSILHSGFHPDCCVIDCNGEFLQTAAYLYHSVIVAGAYLCGLPANRVPALFNRLIYGGLGYLQSREPQDHALCQRFARLGFDAQPIVAKTEIFMHCPNHPTIAALFELATQMVTRVGLVPAPATPPEDWMKKHTLRWPVYAGLSRAEQATNALPELVHGPRIIALQDLIDSSYATYAHHAMNVANCNSPSVVWATQFLSENVRL